MKRLAPLLAMFFWVVAPVNAQFVIEETLTIESIEVSGSEDSLAARRVLDEVPPTSTFWAEQHAEPGFTSAAKALGQVFRAAYPSMDLANPDTAVINEVTRYAESIAAQHPDKGVRAEFLFDALRTATRMGRDEKAVRYYRKIMQEHGGTDYAERAERRYQPDALQAVQKGNSVPDFSLASLADSSEAYTSESFEGKTYLIDLWGTWCAPCIAEMPNLHEAYDEYKDEGFTILSVALDDSAQAVRRFREVRYPMPWDHAVVEDDSRREKAVKEKFEVTGVPKAILVNADGEIVATEEALRGKRLDETLSRVLRDNE